MTTDLDLGKLSHAEKDALILSLVAQLQAALARIAELEKRVAELQRPPKTPDNSSMPPSQGQKPNTAEIRACRQWYERELATLQPSLVVAMGASAAQSVFGKITPIGKNRGRLIDLPDGRKALVTVHPSYLLRLPDEDAKAREYARFVDDLRIAAELLRKSARAA